MNAYLPQKYQEAVRALIPYTPAQSDQILLLGISPALPCFICGQPASNGLAVPDSERRAGWQLFPICAICEERQIKGTKK